MVTPFPDKDYPIVIGIDFGKFLQIYFNKRADFIFQVRLIAGVPMGI